MSRNGSGAGTPGSAQANHKRARLTQERSRATRRALVKAAIELWTERGFETGIETTTAEEIAARAGVSKGTFYFHFAKKEDVLAEMAWLTAESLYATALQELAGGEDVDRVIQDLMEGLGTRVARGSRAAARRLAYMANSGNVHTSDRDGLFRVFAVVITHAQASQELPTTVTPVEVAAMLEAVCMSAIGRWAEIDDIDLPDLLKRQAAILLAGVRHFGP